MTKALPPLTWLRAFECAARHLSFTGAAREMNITQSAVSQHVRLLENRFGASLFVRKARGIALTEAGRRLIPSVAGAMADLVAATEMFDPHHDDNVLELACSNSFARLWLCRHIGDFLDTHPAMDVRVVSAIWPDDYTKVDSDVQIRYGPVELVGEGAEQLLSDVMVPVCHPDLASRFGTVRGYDDVPLIHTVGTANTWERWAKVMGVELTASINLSVDSDELALEMAENRLGVALCGQFLCQSIIETGRLCIPHESGMPSEENYYVTVRENSRNGDAAKSFRSWLFSSIRALPG